MKKLVTWLGISILVLTTVLLAACSTTPAAPAGPVVLTVTNGTTVNTYAMADLQKMKAVTGNGGTKNKTGAVNGPFSYQGVALIDLVNAAGGVSSTQSVKITGSDGYSKTLTYDQVTSGGFTTYDTTGNPITATEKPVLTIVYSMNGAALDSTIGPLELGLLSSQSLVTDGSTWVKLIVKIEIVTAAK